MRPLGHFGLLFTWGLPWTTLAVCVHPTLGVVVAYWGLYLAFRVGMTWLIGIQGLKQEGLGKDALDSALGCTGVSNLAGEFHANFDPLAQCRLSTAKWSIRGECGHLRPGFIH